MLFAIRSALRSALGAGVVFTILSQGQQELAAASRDCQPTPLIQGAARFLKAGPPTLTLVTLNMARERALTRIQDEITRVTPLGRAEILLLQEVETPAGNDPGVVQDLASRLGFNFVYSPANVWKSGSKEGLAILSRYPLENPAVIRLPSFDLLFRNRCRIALTATAVTPFGRIQLFNVHLDSRVSIEERLEQLAPIVQRVREAVGPCVVAGDFNTSGLLWLGRLLPLPAGDHEIRVRNLFTSIGFLTPFVQQKATFDFLGLTLDSIFIKGLNWTSSGIEEIKFSDHRALWITLQFETLAKTA